MNLGESVYRVKEQFQKESIKRKLACDIDDTISQTSKRFYEELSKKFPTSKNITAKEVTKHYALTRKTLHWQDIPEAMSLSKNLGEDENFYATFKPIKNSIYGTQSLDFLEFLGCYLTVRPEYTRTITDNWTTDNGYPIKPLIMRDNSISFDNHAEWKVEALNFLHPQISGIIENDALIAKLLEEKNYPGDIYLIGLNEQEFTSTENITPVEFWPELVNLIKN